MVRHCDNGVQPLPLDAPWQAISEALKEFEPDFQMVRDQPAEQACEAGTDCA